MAQRARMDGGTRSVASAAQPIKRFARENQGFPLIGFPLPEWGLFQRSPPSMMLFS
jgi:hypothetical protein